MASDLQHTSASEGALLLSLDSELKVDDKQVRWAILFHSLFSRRVCVTDTQIIDNPILERFFRKHWHELELERERAEEMKRPPLLGLLSRRGADIGAVLDLMLTANPRTGLPSYFSRLTEQENRDLRDRLGRAANIAEKRGVLFSLEGGLENHIARATSYFQRNPLATIAPFDSSQSMLFPLVRERLEFLNQPWHRRWMGQTDMAVCEALLLEIESTSEAQTRERLHSAIYRGTLPHYYRGQMQLTSPESRDDTRHAWRHLINTFYNFDLARKYSSSPVLNSRWFALPSFLPSDDIPETRKIEKAGSLRANPLYLDQLTIPFVAEVRAEDTFWISLGRLEAASALDDATAYQSALIEHLQFVCSMFAKHLNDIHRKDLLEEKLVDIFDRNMPRVVGPAAVILEGVGLWRGSPWEALGIVTGAVATLRLTSLIARGLIGRAAVRNPRFKAFEVDLGKALNRSRIAKID
jgi:hypothetical protein